MTTHQAAHVAEQLREIAAFLDGSGTFEGRWFGDAPTGFEGRPIRYWWRKELRERVDAAIAALTASPQAAPCAFRRHYPEGGTSGWYDAHVEPELLAAFKASGQTIEFAYPAASPQAAPEGGDTVHGALGYHHHEVITVGREPHRLVDCVLKECNELDEARILVAELVGAGWRALEELHRVSPSWASPRLRAILQRFPRPHEPPMTPEERCMQAALASPQVQGGEECACSMIREQDGMRYCCDCGKPQRAPGVSDRARFEEWFAAVWAGSDGIPVPEWQKEGWNEYIEKRQLALGAWDAALASPQVAPEGFVSMADIRAARYARELGGREATTAEAYEAGYQHGVEVGKRVRAAIDELSAASPQVQGVEARTAEAVRAKLSPPEWAILCNLFQEHHAQRASERLAATPQRAPGVDESPNEQQRRVAKELQEWLDWCWQHGEEPSAESGARIAIAALASGVDDPLEGHGGECIGWWKASEFLFANPDDNVTEKMDQGWQPVALIPPSTAFSLPAAQDQGEGNG
jgi:hypothetical protein